MSEPSVFVQTSAMLAMRYCENSWIVSTDRLASMPATVAAMTSRRLVGALVVRTHVAPQPTKSAMLRAASTISLNASCGSMARFKRKKAFPGDESKPRWSSVAMATHARYAILSALACRPARAERSMPLRATCCVGMSVVPRVTRCAFDG